MQPIIKNLSKLLGSISGLYWGANTGQTFPNAFHNQSAEQCKKVNPKAGLNDCNTLIFKLLIVYEFALHYP